MSYWGLLKKNVALDSGARFRLQSIDLGFVDARRHFYGDAELQMGAGLTVGVIDTGVGPHPDLRLDGGFNAVLDEDATDGSDNGDGHGTHVAGIIAGRGGLGTGVRGIAPGVTLRSYRVFGQGKAGASNFAIAKAIDRAVSDGCDLINMSLSGGVPDMAIQEAVTDARAHGTVVIVAAGNEDRAPVAFPAADSLAIAVSALGRKGTFPRGASEHGDIARPFGKPDRKNFIAAFSNVGSQIDLTAPGVGIISTVPGGYAVLSGTSMASPAVTGAAARLLSHPQHATLISSVRDQARSDAMAQVILQSAVSLGFASTFEGSGIILVS